MTDRTADRPTDLTPVEAARTLKRLGLVWQPRIGDRFMVPDRHLDEHVFTLSDMVVGMRQSIGGLPELSFNGTVEWALDSIMTSEVVWLPTEADLRDALGNAFVALYAEDDAYVCVVRIGGTPTTHAAPTAVEAYAGALTTLLRS
jgi:hypothetical protein